MRCIPSVKLIVLAIIFGFGLSVLPVHPAVAKEDAKMIQVSAVEEGSSPRLIITPSELTVGKNSFVIWLNMIEGQEISVEFDDPGAVIPATTDHQVFSSDDKGYFAAKYMPFIATSSLRFVKAGTYKYTVKSFYGRASATGKVTVR